MKLKAFEAKKVHGYLEFTVEFKDRLTFLTGINGSGKTTILNSIVALLSPSLITLAEIEYDTMYLSFEHEDNDCNIFSFKEGPTIVIEYNNEVEGRFIFNKYLGSDSAYYTPRERDAETDYYRAVLSTGSQNPVIKAISALPIPMFLGLDRRVSLSDDVVRRGVYRNRFARNIFGNSLSQGIADALSLAEDKYRDVLRELSRLENKSRSEILLRSLTIQPTNAFNDLMLPTREASMQIRAVKQDMAALPKILGLQKEDVYSALTPTIELLESLVKALPLAKEGDSTEQALKLLSKSKPQRDDDTIQKAVSWSVNYPLFKRIGFLSEVVKRYNEETERTRRDADHYIKLINRFLKESGKFVEFDSTGTIQFKVEGADKDQTVQFLSSGETQIFVLITQLFFNKAANKANIFIIDEPELSLHIEWQELFVDSILEANEKAQLILASHSPSIILDRVANCVEAKPKHQIQG